MNIEGTRAAIEVPFGIALYEGEEIDGKFSGTHCGVVGSHEEAMEWVNNGPLPAGTIVVHQR